MTEGPFSGIQLRYFNESVRPHCLSRTFRDIETNETGTLSGSHFRPEAIGGLQRREEYDEYRSMLERFGHNVLHWQVQGDLNEFVSPNGKSS